MSDSVAMALISALVTVITTVCGMIVVWLKVQESVKAAEAARELGESNEKSLEKVKVDTAVTNAKTAGALAELAKTATDTHTLVNSNMGVQLRINADLSRWKADKTKDPKDIEAADAAEKLVQDHEARQKVVDSAVKTEGKP